MTIIESLNTRESDLHSYMCYLRNYGGATSISLNQPSCRTFSLSHIQGVICYKLSYDCATVFGDPMCSDEDSSTLAFKFHQHCKEKGWSIIYIGASEKFATWALKNICHSLMQLTEEFVVDPHMNLKSGVKGRALRNKINNAQRSKVEIFEYLTPNASLEDELNKVAETWLGARRGPDIFLLEAKLFEERAGKRWFYAKSNNEIVGVLLLCRMEKRRGWLQQFLITTPNSPLGASELLVVSVLETLKKEECHYYSFGVAISKEIGEIIGLNKISTYTARTVFKFAEKAFSLDKKRRFFKKFQPSTEKNYLLFSSPKIRIKDVLSIKKALNVSF